MELGCGTFPYVPKWKNNRTLPEDQQVSVRMHCLRGRDLFGAEEGEEALRAWAKDAFAEQIKADPGAAKKIGAWSAEVIRLLKVVLEKTDEYKNFRVMGREITDPKELFLTHLPIPAGMDQSGNLAFELYFVLRDTASMTEAELGNYEGPSVGGLTIGNTSALPAQEDGPASVITPQGVTAPSK